MFPLKANPSTVPRIMSGHSIHCSRNSSLLIKICFPFSYSHEQTYCYFSHIKNKFFSWLHFAVSYVYFFGEVLLQHSTHTVLSVFSCRWAPLCKIDVKYQINWSFLRPHLTHFNTLLVNILSLLSSQSTNCLSCPSLVAPLQSLLLILLVLCIFLVLVLPSFPLLSFSFLLPLLPFPSCFLSSILFCLYFLLMCSLLLVLKLSIYLPFPNFYLQPRSLLNSMFIYSTI